MQTPSKTTQTLLSPRIPRDNEHERYHPELEEELKECLFCLQRNAMMFDLEVDSDLIEQRIYERQALLCRYRYLLARARELGLHTVLTKYQLLDRFEQVGSIKILTESPLRVIISKDKCVLGFVRRDEILRVREVFYYGTY